MTKKHGNGGGGIGTRQHVKTPIKSGPPNTKVISHSAAANIGLAKGNHTERGTVQRPADPLVQRKAPQVASGNQKALDVGRGGPGAGRNVMSSGSQGQHGAANPGIAVNLTPGGGPGGFGFKGGR